MNKQKQMKEKNQIFQNYKEMKLMILIGSNDIMLKQLQISQYKNLLKLDISQSNISYLPKLPSSLLHLNVHSNSFQNLSNLSSMFSLKIRYLTIFDNPITVNSYPKIRHFIINIISSLLILDFHVVVPSQKQIKIGFPQPMSEKVYVGYPLLIYPARMSQQQYLKILAHQIILVEELYRRVQPQIIIQRWWIKQLKKKRIKKQQKKPIILNITNEVKQPESKEKKIIKLKDLRSIFSEWKIYSSKQKEVNCILKSKSKEYLNQDVSSYQIFLLKFRIKLYLEKFVQKFRISLIKIKSAKTIYNCYLFKQLFLNSNKGYYYLLQLHQFKRFYFKKNQKALLLNIIASRKKYYKHQHLNYEQQYSIQKCQNLIGLRLIESQRIQNKSNWIINYLYPSMHSLILIKSNQIQSKIKVLRNKIKIKPLFHYFKHLAYLTKQQRQKSIYIYQKLCKYVNEQYYDNLLCLKIKDDEFLKNICCGITYHNRYIANQNYYSKKQLSFNSNQKQKFCIFIDKQLKRVSAAIKIQKTFRGFLSKKNMSFNLFYLISHIRAVILIQKWYRNLKFLHKNNFFFKQIVFYIKELNSLQLYLHMDIYIEVCFKQKQQMMFQEQNGQIYVLNQNCSIYYQIQSCKNVFPPNLCKYLKIKNNIFQKDKCYKGNISNIIFTGTVIEIIEICTIKFIKIQFESIDTARYRSALLALKTYRFYKSNFVKLFMMNQLCGEKIFAYQKKMSDVYSLNFFRAKNKVINKKQIFKAKNKLSFLLDSKQYKKIGNLQVSNVNHKKSQQKVFFYYKQFKSSRPVKFQSCLLIYEFNSIYRTLQKLEYFNYNNIQIKNNDPQKIKLDLFGTLNIKQDNSQIQSVQVLKAKSKQQNKFHKHVDHLKIKFFHSNRNKFLVHKKNQKPQSEYSQVNNLEKKSHSLMKESNKINKHQRQLQKALYFKMQKNKLNKQRKRIHQDYFIQKKKKVSKIRSERKKQQTLKSFVQQFAQKNNFLQKQHFNLTIQYMKQKQYKEKKEKIIKNYQRKSSINNAYSTENSFQNKYTSAQKNTVPLFQKYKQKQSNQRVKDWIIEKQMNMKEIQEYKIQEQKNNKFQLL